MSRPRAVIVVTGSELVRGERTDRNGPFLARELLSLGVEPARILVVGDAEEELEAALREGLAAVASAAAAAGASLHMPRIGTGHAGGSWAVIEDLIRSTCCDAGLPVTVYDLPGAAPPAAEQAEFPLA